MTLCQFVLWDYSWETVRRFSSLWEYIDVMSSAWVFAISSGISIRVVKLSARMRKKLCRVLAFHNMSGVTEENYEKPYVSGIPTRTLQWQARILTSERRYLVFMHILTLSDEHNLDEVDLNVVTAYWNYRNSGGLI
jgi:hypothetical protein